MRLVLLCLPLLVAACGGVPGDRASGVGCIAITAPPATFTLAVTAGGTTASIEVNSY